MIDHALKKLRKDWSGNFSGDSVEIFGDSAHCGDSGLFYGFSADFAISQKQQVIKHHFHHASICP
jgi:hypothetical protein